MYDLMPFLGKMRYISIVLLYLNHIIAVHGQDCIGFIGNKRFFDWTLDDGETRTRISTAWRFQDVAGGPATTVMFKDGNDPAEVDTASDYVGRLFESNRNPNDVGMELINLRGDDEKIYSVVVTFDSPPTTSYFTTLIVQNEGDGINAIQSNCSIFVGSDRYGLGADIPSIDDTVDWGFTCHDCMTPYVNVSLTLLDTASMDDTKECSEVIHCEQEQKTIGPGFTLSYVVGYGDFISNFTSFISDVTTTTASQSSTQTTGSSTASSPLGPTDTSTQSTTADTVTTDPIGTTKQPRNGLEPWHYALIGVGCLIVVIIFIVIIVCCCCKKPRNRQPHQINDPRMTNGHRNGVAQQERNVYVGNPSAPVVFSAKDPSKSVYTPTSQAYSNPGFNEPPVDYDEGAVTRVNVGDYRY